MHNSKKLYISRIKTITLALATALLALSILVFPSSSSQGAKNGIIFCSQILIPSLFPFMVLSSFIVKSGLSAKIGNTLEPVTNLLFRLPGCTAATIVIGLIGGYPAGARGIKALVEQGNISQKQGEKMLLFTVGAGPAFVISVVGAGLLGSSISGIILFAAQILSSLIIGVFCRNILNCEAKNNVHTKKRPTNTDVASALVGSCTDSISGMINMSAFVILFSSFLTIIKDSGIGSIVSSCLVSMGVSPATANSLLSILLEVTGGCSTAAKFGASAELMAFAIGWAGTCVHFQICSSLNGISFSKVRFTIARFVQGVLAAIISHIGFFLFPQASEVFLSTSHTVYAETSSNPLGCIALLILCVFFLLSVDRKNISYHATRI